MNSFQSAAAPPAAPTAAPCPGTTTAADPDCSTTGGGRTGPGWAAAVSVLPLQCLERLTTQSFQLDRDYNPCVGLCYYMKLLEQEKKKKEEEERKKNGYVEYDKEEEEEEEEEDYEEEDDEDYQDDEEYDKEEDYGDDGEEDYDDDEEVEEKEGDSSLEGGEVILKTLFWAVITSTQEPVMIEFYSIVLHFCIRGRKTRIVRPKNGQLTTEDLTLVDHSLTVCRAAILSEILCN